MVVDQVDIPLESGALLTAVPVPKRTGCVGSPAGAIHTWNCSGSGLLAMSVVGVSASTPPTAAGDKLTVAVALPENGTLALIVRRPPVHGSVPLQTLKLYLLMVKLAVLEVIV